jgi:hypothetical protein
VGGGWVSPFAILPANAQPIGLVFDQLGNLYEGGVDVTIRKITPGGVVSTFASGDHTFTSLAATTDAGIPLPVPIPEPASFGLIALSGVALLKRQSRGTRRRGITR